MILRLDRVVQTAQGQAIAGAQVYFLTQPANVATLTPLANVYADLAGTPAPNPQITDGLGQIGCYLDNGQFYTMVVVSPLLETQVYPDQNMGNNSTSNPPTAQVPGGAIDGANRTFTLTTAPTLLFLFYDGQWLTPGLGYSLGGTTITMATAPEPGDSLYAVLFT